MLCQGLVKQGVVGVGKCLDGGRRGGVAVNYANLPPPHGAKPSTVCAGARVLVDARYNSHPPLHTPCVKIVMNACLKSSCPSRIKLMPSWLARAPARVACQ